MTSEQAIFLRDFMLLKIEDEFDITRRVLASVPDEHSDFRLDPQARTLRELAWHIVHTEIEFLSGIINSRFEQDDDGAPDPPPNTAEMVNFYETQFTAGLELIRKLSAKQLVATVPFYGLFRNPTVVYLSFLLDHTIHHRAQLSTYLRALGSRVTVLRVAESNQLALGQAAMKYLWTERPMWKPINADAPNHAPAAAPVNAPNIIRMPRRPTMIAAAA